MKAFFASLLICAMMPSASAILTLDAEFRDNAGTLEFEIKSPVTVFAKANLNTDVDLIIVDAYSTAQTSTHSQNLDPLSISWTGTGTLANPALAEYLNTMANDVEPRDFIIEIGSMLNFQKGDTLTLNTGTFSSQSSWTGNFPNTTGPYTAFFASDNGTTINNLVVPESNALWATSIFFGVVLAYGWRRRIRRRKSP